MKSSNQDHFCLATVWKIVIHLSSGAKITRARGAYQILAVISKPASPEVHMGWSQAVPGTNNNETGGASFGILRKTHGLRTTNNYAKLRPIHNILISNNKFFLKFIICFDIVMSFGILVLYQLDYGYMASAYAIKYHEIDKLLAMYRSI